MRYVDLSDLNDDPELAAALGNMVVAWAYAEAALCAALARVSGMNINMTMMGFYRIPTFESRRKFIEALLTRWDPGKFDKTAIEGEITRLSNLSLTRNNWVHAIWCRDLDSCEIVNFDFRKPETKGRRRQVKASDVRNHTATVVASAKRLRDLVDHLSMAGER